MTGAVDWGEHRARLRRAYEAFVAAAYALDPVARERTGAFGAWSAKDVVCHAAGWDREAVARLAAIRADPRTPDRTYDADAFNAAAVASRRQLHWDAALAELADAHAALASLLVTVTAEEAVRDGRFAEWAVGRAGDYQEHAAQLRALARRDGAWGA